MPPAAKQAASSPAAAKASPTLRKEREGWGTLAGAKPAALTTRLPHDKAVPKPAFELSEKKLEPKAATKAAAKKATKKLAAKQSKAIAPARKPQVTKPFASAAAPAVAPKPQSGEQKPSPAVAKGQGNQGAQQ